MRTQVAIIGGGPAGSLLALLLHDAGIDCVVLERRSQDHVLSRIRAGVLEYGTMQTLRSIGVGERMDEEGFRHDGVNLAFGDGTLRIDFADLVDKHVMIYGQTEVQHDLYDAIQARGIPIIDEAEATQVHGLAGDAASVAFERDGCDERLECEWVAGCDGQYGVSRAALPDEVTSTFERIYPFGWLGILSETPPIDAELIYARHPQGFALCSMRHEMLSRYYVQCAADADPGQWSDDRFWDALTTRLPDEFVANLTTGPSVEKSVTPLRSFVAEPMRHGRLLLAGDAAHIVPPTGAKGLNLAVSDVVYLADALRAVYHDGVHDGVDAYSHDALLRVWKAVRFSWWMTTQMHAFPEVDDAFDQRIAETELAYLADSRAAQTSFAENYTGLPFNIPGD